MKKIAAIGAGNIGKAAARAIELSPDMELCGFIRRELKPVKGFEKFPSVKSVFDLPEKPDGAIICLPSVLMEEAEKELLESGIYTVDAFDIHSELFAMRKRLAESAKKGKVSCIVGAGWDPGLDSVIRTLMTAALPKGIMFTDFGPGMSMGHSDAVRMKDGIENAFSYTLPLGYGEHFRKIYAVLKPGEDKKEVEHRILSDKYFEHERCSIDFLDSIDDFFTTGHSAKITRFGEMGGKLSFSLSGDNPTITGQILASSMRAAFIQKPGAYFMPEIPPVDFCIGSLEKIL